MLHTADVMKISILYINIIYSIFYNDDVNDALYFLIKFHSELCDVACLSVT